MSIQNKSIRVEEVKKAKEALVPESLLFLSRKTVEELISKLSEMCGIINHKNMKASDKITELRKLI